MGGGGEGVVPLEQGAAEGRQTGAEPAAARRRRSRGPGELRGAAIGAREARRRRVSWRLLRAQRHGRVSVCWLRPDTATAGSVMASQPQQRLRKSGCRREQAAEVVARAVRSTPPRPPARVPNAECMRGHLPAYMSAALPLEGSGAQPPVTAQATPKAPAHSGDNELHVLPTPCPGQATPPGAAC